MHQHWGEGAFTPCILLANLAPKANTTAHAKISSTCAVAIATQVAQKGGGAGCTLGQSVACNRVLGNNLPQNWVTMQQNKCSTAFRVMVHGTHCHLATFTYDIRRLYHHIPTNKNHSLPIKSAMFTCNLNPIENPSLANIMGSVRRRPWPC